jgi:phospholipid/cholesterol/gamma-HCH transport system substrate-binding protein
METRAHYVAVGSFVLAIIFLAFVTVLWLGRVQLAQEARAYYIFFRGSVSGLSKGSAVQYNGIPVGRVTDIRVDPDNVEQIQVKIEIDGSLVDIKSDARAFLETNILSGVSIVQIRGGTEGAANLEPRPGHKYPVIQPGQTEIEQVKATLPEVMGDIKSIAHQLSELLNEQNRAALSKTLANVEVVTGDLRAATKDVHTVLAHADDTVIALHGLLSDVDRSYVGPAGLKDQVSDTLGQYRQLAKDVQGTNRQLAQVLQDVRPGLRDFSQRTLGQVPELLGDTRQLVTGLTRLTEEVERNPTRFLFGARNDGYRPR